MISRRAFVVATTAALLGAPLTGRAQDARKRYRVGFLGNSTAALESNLTGPFRDGLRDLGYVEGRDIEIEYRWAEGRYERFPALADELLATKVDVMVTAGTPASLALKRATTKVPVVMVAVGDPVNSGLVASLARPGGNLTGLVSIAPDLEGKRLELLREVVPKLSRVFCLTNPSNPFHRSSEMQVRAAAKALSLNVQFAPVRAEADFDAAFDTIGRERPDGLIMLADRLFLHHRSRIADFATRKRIPGVYAYRELVEVGGLMSFGPSYPGMHRRAAYFVHRILTGATPAELPMEQPAQFELIVNLRTARMLGLNLPPSVLLRTDRVIE